MESISELLILSSEMNFFQSQEGLNPHAIHILHAMKYRTEIIVWSNVNVLYTIPGGPFYNFLILNSEMKDLHWYLLWSFLQY